MKSRAQYAQEMQDQLADWENLAIDDYEVYEKYKEKAPKDKDLREYLKEEKAKSEQNLAECKKKFNEEYENSKKPCEEKKQKLIAETKEKLEELSARRQELKEKGESTEEVRREIEAYELSLSSLESYQPGDGAAFSNSKVRWEITSTQYEPFAQARANGKKAEEKDKELAHAIEATDRILTLKANEKNIRDTFYEKSATVKSWNGWQRFWAKVLPASWYSKAETYKDFQNYKSAVSSLKTNVLIADPVVNNDAPANNGEETVIEDDFIKAVTVSEPKKDVNPIAEKIGEDIKKEEEVASQDKQPVETGKAAETEPSKGNV